jgi:hypothetical protein
MSCSTTITVFPVATSRSNCPYHSRDVGWDNARRDGSSGTCSHRGRSGQAERFAAEVSGNSKCLAPGSSSQRHDFLGITFFIRKVVDDRIRTLTRKGNGRGPTYARVATRDERVAVGQAATSAIGFRAIVGPSHRVDNMLDNTSALKAELRAAQLSTLTISISSRD